MPTNAKRHILIEAASAAPPREPSEILGVLSTLLWLTDHHFYAGITWKLNFQR